MLTLILLQTLPTFATPGSQSHAIVATALGVLARRDFKAVSPDLGFRVDLVERDKGGAMFRVTAKSATSGRPITATLTIPASMIQSTREVEDRYIN